MEMRTHTHTRDNPAMASFGFGFWGEGVMLSVCGRRARRPFMSRSTPCSSALRPRGSERGGAAGVRAQVGWADIARTDELKPRRRAQLGAQARAGHNPRGSEADATAADAALTPQNRRLTRNPRELVRWKREFPATPPTTLPRSATAWHPGSRLQAHGNHGNRCRRGAVELLDDGATDGAAAASTSRARHPLPEARRRRRRRLHRRANGVCAAMLLLLQTRIAGSSAAAACAGPSCELKPPRNDPGHGSAAG
jgi:hypothetical protein